MRLERTLYKDGARCVCLLEDGHLSVTVSTPGEPTRRATRPIGRGGYMPDGEHAMLVGSRLNAGWMARADGEKAAPLDVLAELRFSEQAATAALDVLADNRTIVTLGHGERYGSIVFHLLDLQTAKLRTIEEHIPNIWDFTAIHCAHAHPTKNVVFYVFGSTTYRRDLDADASETIAAFLEYGSPFNHHRIAAVMNAERTHLAFCAAIAGEDAPTYVVRVRALTNDDEPTVFEHALTYASGSLGGLALSPAGSRIAISVESRGEKSSRVEVYDVATGERIYELALEAKGGSYPTVEFRSEDELLVREAYDFEKGVLVVDVRARTMVEELPREIVEPLAISMDGTKHAYANEKGRYDRELRLVDARKGRHSENAVLATRPERAPLKRLVFSRDGSLLIGSGGSSVLVYKALLGPVAVWTEARDGATDVGNGSGETLPFPMTPAALLEDWDSMLGQFPCGSGWVGDRFSLHEARLQVFVPADSALPYDRYWIVWQMVGEYEGKVENSIVSVGEAPIWPEQKMAGHGTIQLPEADDEDSDDEPPDFTALFAMKDEWDEEAFARRPVDPETHTFPTQPNKNERYDRLRIASDALRHRLWLDEPLAVETFAIAPPPGGWKCVYREDGDDVVAHVTERVSPSAHERWQNIAAMLCGEKTPEEIAPRPKTPPPPPKPVGTFAVGDSVRVTSGPFENLTGTVLETGPKLKVEVDIFGRATPVDLRPEDVERT